MPHRGNLGFLDGGAALPVILFVCPLILLLLASGVVRRRWRLAAARREEVMRLAALAAEEADAARAEEEAAAVTYAAISLGQRLTQCAFCFSPTTTRCSRCKAVRYCSRKCQVTHWRQGHKEDCHPPQIDDHSLQQLQSTDLKQMQAELSNLCNRSLNYEGELQKKQVKTSFERSYSQSNFSSDCLNEDDFLGTSGTESTDSSTNLSTSSSFTVSGEASDDASACEDEKVLHDARMGKSSSGMEVHATRVDLKEVPPCKSFNVTSSVDNFSRKSKQNDSSGRSRTFDSEVDAPFPSKFATSDDRTDRKTSEYAGGCQDADIDTVVPQIAHSNNSVDSQFSRDSYYNQSDDKSHFGISSKWTNRAVSPETRSRKFSYNSVLSDSTRPNSTGLAAMGYNKTGAASGRSNDIPFVHSKKLKSLASASYANRASSIGGRHSVLRDTSSKIDNPSGTPRLSETMSLEKNDSNNSKISLRTVIQQLKPSKISRFYSSSLEDDASKYKMLFPYDFFAKLYKYDLAEMRPSGLTNCGNSCYANAVLQCLAFTRPLTAYLLQGLHSTTCPKGEWCFTCELESLVRQAKQGYSPLSTISILSHIHDIGSHLGHGREEDAHEFLRYAIDVMQSVCLKEAGAYAVGKITEETTLIQLTFGGYLRSKIRCMRCQGKSERNERMMDLTVEIHGDIRTLEEALKQFTTTEILEGENKYHCSRCKSYERAKKKLTVLDAPNILTIVLKRFQFGKYGKLNKAVRFPEYLDLAPYMSGTDDKSLYRLYAVVVHLDVLNASFSGHYICYVSSTLGKWYKADDSKVKPVELEKVLSQNAYMLLYARCTPRAPSVIRNATPLCQLKENSRWKEEANAGADADAEKARSHPRILCWNSARCPTSQVQLRLPTSHSFSYEPSNIFKERFELPRTDSSSDNSSLFSYSDEGSWSTESTRNSTSTEEYSEYIFGGTGS
ncbi:ubiquitin carboxyl-terminal hydrolase 17-like [Typha latifolia]|uniref:ubiquitin carboxyl-terminal hydrolase 17-like n=1 Tax=Typha latifolia TaxID=4733 RepID=UPI003C2B07D4